MQHAVFKKFSLFMISAPFVHEIMGFILGLLLMNVNTKTVHRVIKYVSLHKST